MHAACICSVHDGKIHALSMCLFNYLHVACLQQGCKCAVYVHACVWHACMQCAACTCVWCAFICHIGMPGRVYSASALHVAKLSYHIECKISLNYIVHNVKFGKF